MRIPDWGPFNRAMCFNEAFKHLPNYDYYHFSDSDILSFPEAWEATKEVMQGNYEAISPKLSMTALTEEQTKIYTTP